MDGQDDQDEVREENKPQMTQINADNIVMSLRRSGGGDLTPERLKQSGGGQDRGWASDRLLRYARNDIDIQLSLRRSGGGDLTLERLKQSGGGQDRGWASDRLLRCAHNDKVRRLLRCSSNDKMRKGDGDDRYRCGDFAAGAAGGERDAAGERALPGGRYPGGAGQRLGVPG